jgi:hypothetical protein
VSHHEHQPTDLRIKPKAWASVVGHLSHVSGRSAAGTHARGCPAGSWSSWWDGGAASTARDTKRARAAIAGIGAMLCGP